MLRKIDFIEQDCNEEQDVATKKNSIYIYCINLYIYIVCVFVMRYLCIHKIKNND